MKIRILIADDNRVLREGLRYMLESQNGLVVVGAVANGFEAVAMARQAKPDVIIMDIQMPVLDGLAATRTITAEFPQIQVIGFTMHEAPHWTEKMLQAGARCVLTKSCSPQDLCLAIRTVMNAELVMAMPNWPSGASPLASPATRPNA